MTYNTRSNSDSDVQFETKLHEDIQQLVHLSSSTYRPAGSEIVNLPMALDDMSGKAVRDAMQALHTERERLRVLQNRVNDTIYKIEQQFKAPVSQTYRGDYDDIVD